MSETGSGCVLYAVEDGVARITLNRPDRLNASNGQMSEGLTDAFSCAAADPNVRVVLLCGAGRGFCAGADTQVLKELSVGPDAPNAGSRDLRYDGLMLLPKPVIAAVHGPCAGIGLAMACAADIRLATEDAFFVAPFAALGLVAEGGLAWTLSRLMGPSNTADMLFSGRRIAAQEAYAKGLVSHVMPNEGFIDAAMDYARLMAKNAPSSFALMKRQLREADGETFETARHNASVMARMALAGADFKEAMTAKRENQSPQFAPVAATFEPPISRPEA